MTIPESVRGAAPSSAPARGPVHRPGLVLAFLGLAGFMTFLGHLSTQAPAQRESSRAGAWPTARRTPNWVAPAPRVRTAKSGRTTRPACSASWEAVCPTQSPRKSPSSHRLDAAGRPASDMAETADGTGIPRVADNEARDRARTQGRRRFGQEKARCAAPPRAARDDRPDGLQRQRVVGRPTMSATPRTARTPRTSRVSTRCARTLAFGRPTWNVFRVRDGWSRRGRADGRSAGSGGGRAGPGSPSGVPARPSRRPAAGRGAADRSAPCAAHGRGVSGWRRRCRTAPGRRRPGGRAARRPWPGWSSRRTAGSAARTGPGCPAL
ncbi:hypothetical protein GA0115240_138217 [Streptomyces sp. DvalAA-14]|nr:hypothetical protein GA0115240_138217 [Streptomyces sp. DvalAA-14]